MATGAAWLNGNRLTERKKKRKKAKVCLDINRPSQDLDRARAIRTDALAVVVHCIVRERVEGKRVSESEAVRGDAATHRDAAGARRIVEAKPAEEFGSQEVRARRSV